MKKLIILLMLPFFALTQKSVESKQTFTEKNKKEARELIESYRQRVLNGESMGTLARIYSEDPGSAKEGGVIQNVEKGVMVPEFESVAFKLKPGEISEVFETIYGFHFIKLLAINGDKIDLIHILVIPKKGN